AEVPAKDGSERGRRERCAGIHEDFDEPLLQWLSIDDLRRWRDLEPNASGDPFSLQKSRGDPKVLDAGVRAGAEEGDIDLGPLDVLDRFQIRGVRGTRDLGAHAIDLEGERLREGRVFVGSDGMERAARGGEGLFR